MKQYLSRGCSRFNLGQILLVTCLTSFLFSSSLSAWHDNGHMIVAKVAEKNLDRNILMKLDKLITENSRDYPIANNFTTASVWPDDIKEHGLNFYNVWHYQSSYYSVDDTPLPKAYNSGKAFAMLRKHITLLQSDLTTDYEKAFSLKFIIHLYGDMHQPMHSASRVSKDYPRGDMGGNYFDLDDSDYTNLHSLWDSGLKSLPILKRPLSRDSQYNLDKYTDNLITSYPISAFSDEVVNAEFKTWQQENLNLMQTKVYKDIEPNTKPSTAYLRTNRDTIEKQLVLAGYRLANKLNCLYGSDRCNKS